MAAAKKIEIDEELFEELQEVAEPLVDDINSVLRKLLKAWKAQSNAVRESGEGYWISSRGERFRIGTKLRATYKGKEFWALVQKQGIEYQGKFYGSPSKAAIAAKQSIGLKGEMTNTNGWNFWQFFDHSAEAWFPIQVLRKSKISD